MRLYAAADGSVLSVSGPPGSPTVRRRLEDRTLECVAADSRAPDRAFCGTFDRGLFRTTDGGETWHPVGRDTVAESVTSLAISPDDPGVVYAGTEPSAVFRSRDGGETWSELPPLTGLPSTSTWAFPPRPHTHHARWIEIDPCDPQRLFVAVEAGALVTSPDGGESWVDRVPSSKRDVHSMATHRDRPGRIWAAAGDGYAESDDGGETWETPTDGLRHNYCWNVAVDPSAPESVLVTSARGPRQAHSTSSAEAYLYRRRGSEPWTRLDDTGLPTGEGATRAVLATGAAGGECYAANDHGIFRTTDFGDSWTQLDVPWRESRQTASGLAVAD
ncbi:BNR repeat-containing protein [Haloferax elongans ATCC BAA-1513]|uniref:BNR repeat-containing protein n=1 Tax=Haloferax elongans ATCC BAA-1513 TaxID=1230453 RepID=M0HV32_HALEO|nr:hypothetical protein [Haloferax elongans]ELZ87517.1 BNR repeat-containing protein [Haloferax elongans ATCC BAA-1513]